MTRGGLEARAASRLPPLHVAVPGMVLALVASLRMGVFLVDLWRGRSGADFSEYYVAGIVGRLRGWPAIYDVHLYSAALRALTGNRDAFVNLPLAAWLALPLTALPFRAADVLWQSALVLVFLWTWRASTTGSGWFRAVLLLAAVATYPVLFAIHLGQLVLLVAGLLVLHWRLLASGRPVLAGIVLGLAFLKPQDVALVPVVLLLTGRWKAAASCAATVAVLAGAVLFALGPQGIHAYQSSLAYEMARAFYVRHTLPAHLPSWAPLEVVRLAVLAMALTVAVLAGVRRYERALAAAVLGCFLVTPYLNAEDLTLLVVCAWLVLRAETPVWMRLAMVASYPVLALDNVLPAQLLIGVELAWLVLLTADAIRSADRPAWFRGFPRLARPVAAVESGSGD